MARFLRSWLIVLIGLSAAVAAFNIVIDPFGILDMPRYPGLNADKIAAADWPRLAKPYMVEAVDPATIVIGVSNVDVGIDPESVAWPAADRPVFNLAVDGATGVVLTRFLQHSLVRTHPKRVLIGLSFEDAFVTPASAGARGDAPDQGQWGYASRMRLGADGRPNPDYAEGRLKDLAFAIFSFDALENSLLTVLGQYNPDNTHETRLGFNSGGKFARWARDEGWYSLVTDKNRQLAPRFIAFAQHPAVSVQPAIDMIRLARAHGAEPILFIMPGYVDKLEMFRQVGVIDRFFAWKTELAAAVEQAAAGGAPVPLWDFSDFSRYITEPLPAAGDTRSQMQWTWEPIHFRAALGDLMIARMLTDGGPADLGSRILARDLPAREVAFVREQAAWEAAHPSDVARIEGALAEAGRSMSEEGRQSFFAKKDQKTLIR